MHRRLYEAFAGQDYPHADLWILDDSPGAPSPFLSQLSDARVHYLHEPSKRISVGAKRNRLVEASSGAVIAHFDDDDWYHAYYLSRMVERLRSTNSDLVKLAKWNERQARSGQLNEYMSRTHAGLWGYGFTYVYRRFVMTRVSFPEIDRDEDIAFVGGLWRAGLIGTLIHDGVGWVEHLLHDSNMSRREP
jgi:hypothetical protein